jgi:nucleoside 2-deoxyribosyltransferase
VKTTYIYIAGAIAERELCEEYACSLRDAGYVVTSTWHHPGPRVDELELPEEQRHGLLQWNDAQMARADIILAIAFVGSPRSTFCEVGAAITRGKPVVSLHMGRSGRFLWDSHPKVVRLDLLDPRGRIIGDAIGEALSR